MRSQLFACEKLEKVLCIYGVPTAVCRQKCISRRFPLTNNNMLLGQDFLWCSWFCVCLKVLRVQKYSIKKITVNYIYRLKSDIAIIIFILIRILHLCSQKSDRIVVWRTNSAMVEVKKYHEKNYPKRIMCLYQFYKTHHLWITLPND